MLCLIRLKLMNQSLRNLSISGIVAVALLLLSAQAVNACGCYPRSTVLQDYEKANLVIIARLVSLVKATEPTGRPGGDISSATMVVEKVFKGEVEAKQKLTFGQGDEILGCSWSFYEKMIGERYLLYLSQPEKLSERFYITTCNRSRGLEYADDDLLYLNNIDKVRGQTRVSGILNVDGGEDGGQTIRIIGKRKTYAATTDKNGVYELYDLPPGRYILESELKFGWKVDEFHLTRQLTRSEMINPRPPSNRVAFTLRQENTLASTFGSG